MVHVGRQDGGNKCLTDTERGFCRHNPTEQFHRGSASIEISMGKQTEILQCQELQCNCPWCQKENPILTI